MTQRPSTGGLGDSVHFRRMHGERVSLAPVYRNRPQPDIYTKLPALPGGLDGSSGHRFMTWMIVRGGVTQSTAIKSAPTKSLAFRGGLRCSGIRSLRGFLLPLSGNLLRLAGVGSRNGRGGVQKVIAGTSRPASTRRSRNCWRKIPPAHNGVMWDYTDFALAAYWLKRADARGRPGHDHRLPSRRGPLAGQRRSADQQAQLLQAALPVGTGVLSLPPPQRILSRPDEPGRREGRRRNALELDLHGLPQKCLVAGRQLATMGYRKHRGRAVGQHVAQIVAEHPDYRQRRYADGTPAAEMARAFDEYYQRFTRNRAGKGLLVECASGYNKWTLNPWYNIADFARDPLTRRRMRMFLDLYWAEWAIEQIDAVRGGSRHRCYPGPGSTRGKRRGGRAVVVLFRHRHAREHQSRPDRRGDHLLPPFAAGGRPGLGRGGARHLCLYFPSPGAGKIVQPIVRRAIFCQGRGVSRRVPAGTFSTRTAATCCATPGAPPTSLWARAWFPALPLNNWTRISSQNRWEGVIFGGHPTAHIFVQPIIKKSFYNGNWSVQNRGAMIVQRLKTSEGCSGQRVWFDGVLVRRETGGWVFAEAPGRTPPFASWRARADWQPDKPLGRKQKTASGSWLNCSQECTPVILEVARKGDYADFAAFQKAILANSLRLEGKRLDYRSNFYNTNLTLFADYSPCAPGRRRSGELQPAHRLYQKPVHPGRFRPRRGYPPQRPPPTDPGFHASRRNVTCAAPVSLRRYSPPPISELPSRSPNQPEPAQPSASAEGIGTDGHGAPNLEGVVAAWGSLPEHVRQTILTLIETA